MESLEQLENRSVHILREAYSQISSLAMLWSIGKDSTVMLHLVRKAFLGHVPIPLVHIDTSYKVPEMIAYRDRLVKEFKLNLVYGQNEQALKDKNTYPDGKLDRISCCRLLKTQALSETLSGTGPRYRFNHGSGNYELENKPEPYTGVIAGVRADEEGSRSKERYFSPRDDKNLWDVGNQPPEFWQQYNTDFPRGCHVRIHPLLDWTELNIWQYIEREKISVVPLYFDQGQGTRYRSLGCYPCTNPISSTARNAKEIIDELKSGSLKNVAERSGRAQDAEGGGLEELRRKGYM